MAFGGSLGKLFGLGTTEQFITKVTGNPGIGAGAQVLADFVSPAGDKIEAAFQQGGGGTTERPTIQNIPLESGSGENEPGIRPASFNPTIVNAPMVSGGMVTPANLPLVTGVGGAVVATIADFIIDQFGNQKKLIITRRLKSKTRQLFND